MATKREQEDAMVARQADRIISGQADAIKSQRMIIDRLMRHCLFHHDELGIIRAEDCKYAEEAKGAQARAAEGTIQQGASSDAGASSNAGAIGGEVLGHSGPAGRSPETAG